MKIVIREDKFRQWLDDYYPYRNRNYRQEILYAKNKYDDTYLEYELLEMYKDTKQHLIDIMQEDEKLGLYEEPKANFDRKIGFAELRAKEMVRQTIFGKQQETLEEAAHEYFKRGQLGFEKAADTEEAFLRGAKWQQERSYSEEDLKSAFFNGGNMKDIEEFNHWFEQSKKK